MKKATGWKVFATTALCGVVLAGAIYYANCVYVPAQKAAVIAEAKPTSEKKKEPNYTVHKSTAVSNAAAPTSVAKDAAKSAAPAVTVTQKDSKNVYVKRTWSDKTSTTTAKTVVKPAASTPKKTTSAPAIKKASTAVKKPVASTAAPKNGAERVVNGKKQMYDEVFGWVDEGSGSQDTYLDMETSGEYIGEMG